MAQSRTTFLVVVIPRTLEAALYAEGDKLHADATLWPRATADALLQARTYAHRVRRFLVADAPTEAQKNFAHVETLRDLLDADAVRALDALAAFFGETKG